jgi:hypothetical protein
VAAAEETRMKREEVEKQVEALIKKAAEVKDSGEALRFSQAAQNAASAYATMCHAERDFTTGAGP